MRFSTAPSPSCFAADAAAFDGVMAAFRDKSVGDEARAAAVARVAALAGRAHEERTEALRGQVLPREEDIPAVEARLLLRGEPSHRHVGGVFAHHPPRRRRAGRLAAALRAERSQERGHGAKTTGRAAAPVGHACNVSRRRSPVGPCGVESQRR